MGALRKLSTILASTARRNLLADAANKYLEFLRHLTQRKGLSYYVVVIGRKECVIYRDKDGGIVQVIRTQDLLTKES